MHNQFTAIIERDQDWFVAYCPEIPGANGQGRTKAESLQSLSDAVEVPDILARSICRRLSVSEVTRWAKRAYAVCLA